MPYNIIKGYYTVFIKQLAASTSTRPGCCEHSSHLCLCKKMPRLSQRCWCMLSVTRALSPPCLTLSPFLLSLSFLSLFSLVFAQGSRFKVYRKCTMHLKLSPKYMQSSPCCVSICPSVHATSSQKHKMLSQKAVYISSNLRSS